MNDLISRQAAIDAISCDIIVTGRQNAELVAATIGAFADRIKALPSAQPEPQWIPCSEGLPEEEDTYIVAFDKRCLREDEIQVSDAIWKDNQWQYQMLESFEKRMPRLVVEPIKELKIIAWMPLPEPYEGEES